MDKNKNKWISDKIRELEHEKKGRSHAQNIAIAISMAHSKQQGGIVDPTKAFIEKSAAQLPISRINYNVETTGVKEGNLQPGYYTRVDYNNGKSDYLNPSGLDELRRMNNYRLYMEKQNQQVPIQMGQAIAMPSYEYGGFSFPNIMNNYQPEEQVNNFNVQQDFRNIPSLAGTMTPAGLVNTPSAAKITAPSSTDIATDLQQKQNQRATQYNNINKINLFNPYGGVSMENALYFGAQGFGQGNAWQGALGSLTAGLKAARIGMSGYAAGKENQRVTDYMRNQLYNQEPNYQFGQTGQNATYLFQEGGKVPTNADMLTGAYITDQPNANLKIEDAEYVKNSQTGAIQKAVGDKHEAPSGGIPVNLPAMSKVLSDFTKIGAKNVKLFKDKFDINVKATDTFAKVMDKVNTKIGIERLLKEEKEYAEKMERQVKSSIDKKTKEINLNFIAKELEEVEKEKQSLKPLQDEAFEEIFRLQEQIPKRGDGTTLLKQEGGYTPDIIEISRKYNLSPERAMELLQEGGMSQQEQMPQEQVSQEEQIMQAVAEMLQQGMQPEDIIQQLLQMGVPEEMAMQVIQAVMQGAQQQQPMAQEGGQMQADPAQIVEAFAQLTQQDPQQIAAQLQQMQPEEQSQALQQMMAALQQEQQNPQEEQVEGQMSNPKEEMQEMKKGGYSLPMAQQGALTYEQQMSQLASQNNALGTNQAVPGVWTGEAANQFYTPYSAWETYLGRTPKNLSTQEIYQKGISSDLNPQLSKLISEGQMPLTNKHRALLKKAGVKNADKIISYTTLSEADKKKVGADFITRGYVDTFAGHRGVSVQPGELTQEEYNKLSGKYDKLTDKEGRQIYAKYDKDGNILRDDKGSFVFYYPKKGAIPEKQVPSDKVAEETKKTVEVATTPEKVNRLVNQTRMADLPVSFNLPPSALQSVYKPEVTLSRMEAIKGSPEANLAAIESQRQAATEQNYFLPDIQRAAFNANLLGTSQAQANQAIGQVTQANTAQQAQTDMYNAQQADKEQLANIGFDQAYENKMYGAINATDSDIRKYFAQNNAQNRQNFMDISNLNMINAKYDNFQTTGSDIYFNNQQPNISIPQAEQELMKIYSDTANNPAARAKAIKELSLKYQQTV